MNKLKLILQDKHFYYLLFWMYIFICVVTMCYVQVKNNQPDFRLVYTTQIEGARYPKTVDIYWDSEKDLYQLVVDDEGQIHEATEQRKARW